MRTTLRLLGAVLFFAVFYAGAYFFMGTIGAVAKTAEIVNPGSTKAAAIANAEFRKEVETMQAQKALALADSMATTTPIAAQCPLLTRILRQGQSDKDTDGQVSKLQKFLAERYAVQEDIVTGYFGPKTKKYLVQWQAQLGFDKTGATGPLTRSSIHSLCNSPTAMGATTKNGASVGFDTAPRISMFSVTPATGTAPVAVSVNFTISTLCKGYSLSWGDGEVATVVAFATTTPNVVCTGNGAVVQRGHIYKVPGVYTVTLGSSTAQVTINK